MLNDLVFYVAPNNENFNDILLSIKSIGVNPDEDFLWKVLNKNVPMYYKFNEIMNLLDGGNN